MAYRAQATNTTFELHSLGWKSFQDLCVSVLSEVLGQTVHQFIPTKDAGRDGAFYGEWNRKKVGGNGVDGRYAVQCKFSAIPNKTLSLSMLKDEIEKATLLASNGLADNYILMTNMKVSARTEPQIRDAFLGINGIESFFIFGTEWINQKILESSKLRMLVPRIYGLGDLTQILDQRAYRQAQSILSGMSEDLSKLVVTEAHRKSVHAIVEHGFVMLLGAPMSGKSTIGASLAMGAIDEWHCVTLQIKSPSEFSAHWNPDEPRQFFWVDDVFGATQYQSSNVAEWNKMFPLMHAAIKKGARIIFTSRDYIFKAAQQDLKAYAFPFINESQVVINLQEFTLREKEQILYNHIKLGTQSKEYKKRIKPFLSGVASNREFLPEVARRLGHPFFTKNLILNVNRIKTFVEAPLAFLKDIISSLDIHSKAAIALIFMNGGRIKSPLFLSESEVQATALLGSSQHGVVEALNNLENSLIKNVIEEGHSYWKYHHPTISDAYAEYIASNKELLHIYLAGAKLDKLLSEVACGEIGIEGEKIVLAVDHYPALIDRLKVLPASDSGIAHFLATKCDSAFLKLYAGEHPELMSPRIGSYLYVFISEIRIVAKLNRYGLLPESNRKNLVHEISELTIGTPDGTILDSDVMADLFTEVEHDLLKSEIKESLIPNLEKEVESHKDDFQHNSDDEPDAHFHELKKSFKKMKTLFPGDSKEHRALDNALNEIECAIEYLNEGLESKDDPDNYDDYLEGINSGGTDEGRSMFDDVDE